MRHPLLRLGLLCACALAGAYLCSSGLLRLNEVFFQVRAPATSGSSLSTTVDPTSNELRPEPVYDRLVIVLIDALRADMVLGSSAIYGEQTGTDPHRSRAELNEFMPYTRATVETGQALAYVGHASVPTVTMPRLKALVTGKAPAFIDILKNFNSAALTDENLVAMLADAGKRIVFYGDDTWLKLFPDAFQRADGTSGFFTRDTVEVDDNVTRHLKDELDPTLRHDKSKDWDVLVLHYLGLDHVGHLRGPRSSLMTDKLREMDAVVERIHASVQAQDQQRKLEDSNARPSLILLCSDHGMSEVGNHGGATVEESSALMLFLRGDGEKLRPELAPYKQRRMQVDVVPTVASLFGLQIPTYSTGLVLEEVVRASTRSTPRYFDMALYANLQQLRALGVIKFHASSFVEFESRYGTVIQQFRDRVLKVGQDIDDEQLADSNGDAVLEASRYLQDKLAQSDGSEYDLRTLGVGLVLLVLSVFGALHALYNSQTKFFDSAVKMDLPALVLLIGCIVQIASLSSSSSIENEHATVFFLITTLLLACIADALSRGRGCTSQVAIYVALLVATRALRARNQVINFGRLNGLDVDPNAAGNEFANDDSLSILSTAPLLPLRVASPTWCIVVVYLTVAWKAIAAIIDDEQYKLQKHRLSAVIASELLFTMGMAAVAGAKVSSASAEDPSDSSSWLDADGFARVVYGCSVLLMISTLLGSSSRLRHIRAEMSIWLVVCLVQRDSQLPTLALLAGMVFAVTWSLRCDESAFRRKILVAGLGGWLSQAAFVALGNSHLVTTIDISQSYLGLTGYSQGVVGLLTFVGVYSGPLVCLANLVQWINSVASRDPNNANAALAIFTYQAVRFVVYTIVVYGMRFHLFIWSVFAPKMLYELANLIVALIGAVCVANSEVASSPAVSQL